MASLRGRERADGTVAWAVLYSLNSQQTSVTFDSEIEALEFKGAVESIGPDRAMKAWGIAVTKRAAARSTAPTVKQWLEQYIATRTGVTKATLYDYTSYLRNDIAEPLGDIPLDVLSPDDIGEWVRGMDSSGKTIANKHGFLSAALNAAVTARIIPVNPAAGTRIPRTEKQEMVFLTHDEFDLLLGCFTEYWRPMVDFMVASGARFGELTAIRPSDIDRDRGTVHIGRGWKRTYDSVGYELGAPKTKRSVRTILVAPQFLEPLDYSHTYVFTNTKGNPVRAPSFRNNVWYPALDKAAQKGLKKRPRIHDMRHTCASWMIAGGADLYAVQRHLGHESISTTVNLYTHLDHRQARAAADIIGRARSASNRV